MSRCRVRLVRQNILVFLLLFAAAVSAEPLYLERVKQVDVSDKMLQKSLKQLEEYKEINVVDNFSVPPFHKQTTLAATEKQPFCTTCHLSLPHRKNERSRTFMNMHSRYIACETCHFRPKETALAYRWLAYDGFDGGRTLAPRSAIELIVDVPPQPERKHKKQFEKRVPLAPQPGARLTPFFNDAPVLLFKDDPFAQQTKKKWKDADKALRAEIKARLHAPLEKEGPVCNKCHGKRKPMFDLEALGATPAQLKVIQNNIIIRFFDRFKKDNERIRIDKLLR